MDDRDRPHVKGPAVVSASRRARERERAAHCSLSAFFLPNRAGEGKISLCRVAASSRRRKAVDDDDAHLRPRAAYPNTSLRVKITYESISAPTAHEASSVMQKARLIPSYGVAPPL